MSGSLMNPSIDNTMVVFRGSDDQKTFRVLFIYVLFSKTWSSGMVIDLLNIISLLLGRVIFIPDGSLLILSRNENA